MAAQKMTAFFTFLVLYAFMEETKLAMASEVIICEHEERAIWCGFGTRIIHVFQASYGRQNSYTCPSSDEDTSNTNCYENSHAIVGATCRYKNLCILRADNSVFGDPCPGTYKYLRVTYQCADLFVLCEGTRRTLRCPEGKTIKLLQASYGRDDRTTCPSDNMSNTNCHSGNTRTIVQEKCHGEPSCELFADNSAFGDPCPRTHKYLRVTYECI